MKNQVIIPCFKGLQKLFCTLIIALVGLFSTIVAFAQEVPEKVDVDIEAESGTMWYGQPWVWVIGVALFIIVIVAITRSGSNRNA